MVLGVVSSSVAHHLPVTSGQRAASRGHAHEDGAPASSTTGHSGRAISRGRAQRGHRRNETTSPQCWSASRHTKAAAAGPSSRQAQSSAHRRDDSKRPKIASKILHSARCLSSWEHFVVCSVGRRGHSSRGRRLLSSTRHTHSNIRRRLGRCRRSHTTTEHSSPLGWWRRPFL
jgi:hypothetical protein